MKRTVRIAAVVTALIVGAVGIGWLYFQANPDAWQEFVAEMQTESSSRQPVKRPARKAGTLAASGTIEAEVITSAAEVGGRVIEVAAGEGDEVTTGQVLLRIDPSTLQAQRSGAEASVAQAQAGLDAARAQLALAKAAARSEDLAAAEGAVVAARGSTAAAEAALQQAEISATIAESTQEAEAAVAAAAAALAQAQGMVDVAQAGLAQARAELARMQSGARPEEIAIYEAYLWKAEAELWYPIHAHEQLIHHDIFGDPEEQARHEAEAAQAVRDAAKAQLDLVRAGATDNEIAAARAGVNAAQAQVSIAQAGVEAAEATLAQAEAALETAQAQAALADAQVAAAQARLAVTEGQLTQAEAQRDRLQAGATAEEIAVLEAGVAQAEAILVAAEAALETLELQLARTSLTAPVSGVILEKLVHAGELAAPGAPLFTIADLDEVTLTGYVPEAELGQVSLGQTVEVTVDAYRGAFAGRVTHIASQAEFTPKNVQTQEERVHMVFAVKILLENPDHQLKPGMPADAVFVP
jgi:multidrug resistance efflux pump